jgi:hypothetical protein
MTGSKIAVFGATGGRSGEVVRGALDRTVSAVAIRAGTRDRSTERTPEMNDLGDLFRFKRDLGEVDGLAGIVDRTRNLSPSPSTFDGRLNVNVARVQIA